jgi:molybdopterin molybdotransferase
MQTMISATEAMDLVLAQAQPAAAGGSEVLATESLGLVLGRAVIADRDYPPFDRSVMDGYAVRLSHAGQGVSVRGEARPGVVTTGGPDADTVLEIMTGAPCPPGTEAVVMKEEVRREGSRATFPGTIEPGQNIVRAGAECREGSVVLPAGATLTPLALGLLAAVGQRSVWARQPASLALLITGDEVVQPGRAPGSVEIRDSNGPMLAAMARSLGLPSPALFSVRDTRDALAAALEASSAADVVVLTGGVSAGNYDLVPGALASYGAEIIFHKVRQQPGKPILFAVKGPRLFFGLPGTPLGCHLGFHRYVSPALRALAGLAPARPPERGVMAGAWGTKSERQQFVLAQVTPVGDAWGVTPLVSKGSSDLFTPWAANAYLNVPEGVRELPVGAAVTFDWLAGST